MPNECELVAAETPDDMRERMRALFDGYDPTDEELELMLEYERLTGFEPVWAPNAKSAEGFRDGISADMRWFIDWALEVAQTLDLAIDAHYASDEEE